MNDRVFSFSIMVVESIVEASQLVFTPTNILMIFLGIMLGTVVGSIPGFTGSNAVAIALPFTLVLEPVNALVFMICVYGGAQYGSAIPAILMNTPGTAGAAATCLDGYPMAKQGKADLALGISIMGSVIGGLAAGTIVFLMLPTIGQFAFQFANPEIFLVTLLAMVMIAVAIGDDLARGLVAVMLGILIAAMPLDPLTGQSRLDFGFYELYDAVPFIPIVIGLFAIAELYYLTRQDKISTADVEIGSYAKVIEGFKYVLVRPFQVVRATFLGLVLGSLPGAGASFANFVAWIVAKNGSDDPDSFAEGNPDGVLAAETSNNAVSGGALVPTLSLGIPGNSTTAVMLAALYLQGIQPGPNLLRNFAVEIDALLLSLILGQFVLLVFAFIASKYIVQVVTTPTQYLIPGIMVITAMGAFAMRGLVFDIYLMVLFGFIAIMMIEHGYPVVPVLIGVIIGPIAENAFRRSMALSGNDPAILFGSRITQVLWVLIVFTILWQPIKWHLKSNTNLGKRLPF